MGANPKLAKVTVTSRYFDVVLNRSVRVGEQLQVPADRAKVLIDKKLVTLDAIYETPVKTAPIMDASASEPAVISKSERKRLDAEKAPSKRKSAKK